jgi:hypothetical protein
VWSEETWVDISGKSISTQLLGEALNKKSFCRGRGVGGRAERVNSKITVLEVMMLRTCQRYFQKDWLDRVFGIEGPSNTEIFLFWRKIYSNILLCLLKPKNDYVYIW